MQAASPPWPCPACAELVPAGQDCPGCRLSANWIDLILAVDFTIRQFHFFSVTGEITRPQYRLIVADSRKWHDELVHEGQLGRPAPEVAGLQPRSQCWKCGEPGSGAEEYCSHCRLPLNTSEVRLLRYQ